MCLPVNRRGAPRVAQSAQNWVIREQLSWTHATAHIFFFHSTSLPRSVSLRARNQRGDRDDVRRRNRNQTATYSPEPNRGAGQHGGGGTGRCENGPIGAFRRRRYQQLECFSIAWLVFLFPSVHTGEGAIG